METTREAVTRVVYEDGGGECVVEVRDTRLGVRLAGGYAGDLAAVVITFASATDARAVGKALLAHVGGGGK